MSRPKTSPGNAPRNANSRVTRHSPGEFRALVQAYPVIPAVRSQEDALAVQSPSRVVYLLAAGLATLDEYLHILRSASAMSEPAGGYFFAQGDTL